MTRLPSSVSPSPLERGPLTLSLRLGLPAETAFNHTSPRRDSTTDASGITHPVNKKMALTPRRPRLSYLDSGNEPTIKSYKEY
ncbi:LOW QUALITY PROTEIN: hypothetical protein BC936DRAFT_146030 [Jimgerdemannia flammicorona]|uniref:Uncharacterized protein n=1 Tax=Jimgerdemannia flammicorona TaxID=994334 RepID=A0A433D8N5_9FUNG|nr:LOW QUALITY PROTEIN: hypothetical protein BC936DRAFT_146030 [Jimgerdemannia flammicorona]